MDYYDEPILYYGTTNGWFTSGVHNVATSDRYPHDWVVCWNGQIYSINDEKLAKRVFKELKKDGISHDIVQHMLKKLLKFVPGYFPYKKDVYGHSTNDFKETPFFTEAYLYSLIGKEDARTILSLLKKLCRAAGIDDADRYNL